MLLVNCCFGKGESVELKERLTAGLSGWSKLKKGGGEVPHRQGLLGGQAWAGTLSSHRSAVQAGIQHHCIGKNYSRLLFLFSFSFFFQFSSGK